jgi:hypothetical protein
MRSLGDEGSRAIVADERVLVENQTHLEIKSAGDVLIEQGHDDAVATKTSELRVGPLRLVLRPRFSTVLRTPCHCSGLPTCVPRGRQPGNRLKPDFDTNGYIALNIALSCSSHQPLA